MFKRRQQPGLLAQLDDIRRERRRPRIAGLQLLQRAVQVSNEAALVDLVVTKYGGDIAIRSVSQSEQPMFDLNIVMSARQCQTRGRLERTPARVVQPADKLFEIDRRHAVSPFPVTFPGGKSPFSLLETMCYAEPLSSE